MQAFPFRSGGTATISVAENLASLHQHAMSNVPEAEAAQPLGLPQRGNSGAWRGGVVTSMVSGVQSAQFDRHPSDIYIASNDSIQGAPWPP